MGNLENISADYLRDLLEETDDVDATKRLMVAITYKEIDGLSQNEAAELYGYSSGWASRWFRRLERLEVEPYEEVLHDDPRPGRPSKLSDDQRATFEAVVHAPPTEVGIDAPAWTVAHARQYLEDAFDVTYSDRHIRRLLREAGLSWEAAHPERTRTDEQPSEEDRGRRTIWTAI